MARRLRDVPDLEVRYLQELKDELTGVKGGDASLALIRDRLATVYAQQGKFADAAVQLGELFESYTKQDPMVVRALRDCVEAFRTGKARRTLIVLSSIQEIPPEGEKVAAIVDWALPSREDLCTLVAAIRQQTDFKGDTPPVVAARPGPTAPRALSR